MGPACQHPTAAFARPPVAVARHARPPPHARPSPSPSPATPGRLCALARRRSPPRQSALRGCAAPLPGLACQRRLNVLLPSCLGRLFLPAAPQPPSPGTGSAYSYRRRLCQEFATEDRIPMITSGIVQRRTRDTRNGVGGSFDSDHLKAWYMRISTARRTASTTIATNYTRVYDSSYTMLITDCSRCLNSVARLN